MGPIEAEEEIVLFVDDEANILSALRRALHSWADRQGVTIETANSAISALAYLEEKSRQVVVIVSDLRMPEMLGSDFLLKVKELHPWILTILLTGFSEVQELMKAVQAGIYSYIMKPWNTEYLIAELNKCLEAQRLRVETEAKAKAVEEELRWAGEMQRAFLRPTLGKTEGIEFDNWYEPLQGLYCGGDYYDIIDLGAGRYFFLLGDVAGHGIKAAFITGILKAVIYPEYIKLVKDRSFLPSAFLAWLNNRMNFELRKTSELIITFFAGIIDLRARTLTYSNAGHCKPFIKSKAGLRELPLFGPSLGYGDDIAYEAGTEALNPGDLLFAYTDGLSEAGAFATGACLIDVGALLGSTEEGPDFLRRILAKALEEAKVPEFSDDVTLMTARLL